MDVLKGDLQKSKGTKESPEQCSRRYNGGAQGGRGKGALPILGA